MREGKKRAGLAGAIEGSSKLEGKSVVKLISAKGLSQKIELSSGEEGKVIGRIRHTINCQIRTGSFSS